MITLRVLITGSRGQLGRDLFTLFHKEDEVYCWDLPELDFTDHKMTLRKILQFKPDLVLHSGAYTDVKGCERNREKAYLVNSLGTRNVAVATQKCNATMVYISTDYVFDGKKGAPLTEFDQTNPVNHYGKSKLVGEEYVKDLVKKHFIVRTAWLYNEDGENFVKTMIRLGQSKRQLSVVSDQWGTPTYTKDLATVIKEMIKEPFYGTYHASNNGATSWYDFARAIFKILGMNVKVTSVNSREYADKTVRRPSYSVMKNFNLEKTYGIVMRDWKAALRDCLEQMKLG